MGDKSAFVGIVTKLFDITGKALSGEWGTDDPDCCGIPVLRTTNFTNVGKVNYDNVVTRNIQKKNISEKLLKKGDIIIEKSGGTDKNPVGRVIYFEGEENKYLFNNFTGLLRVKDKNEWYPRYVFYSMFACYKRGGTRRFENKTTGLHNLKLDDYIKRLDIQKASYVDQVHVCKLLDCVRLQIDNMERELELLDELVKARFVEMFGTIYDKKFDMKTLPDIVSSDKNSIKRGPFGGALKKEDFLEDGYMVYEQRHAIHEDFEYAKYYVSPEKYESMIGFKVVPGDLIISCSGTLGRIAEVPMGAKEGIINQALLKISLNKDIMNNQFFIYQFRCKEIQDMLFGISRGSGIANMPSMNEVKAFKFICPPLELQNQFASFVQEIDKSRSRIQKSLEASQELFDSLMQEYFG